MCNGKDDLGLRDFSDGLVNRETGYRTPNGYVVIPNSVSEGGVTGGVSAGGTLNATSGSPAYASFAVAAATKANQQISEIQRMKTATASERRKFVERHSGTSINLRSRNGSIFHRTLSKSGANKLYDNAIAYGQFGGSK